MIRINLIKNRKVCSKCGEEKELEEFGVDGHGFMGKKSYCKECKGKYDKEYRNIEENKIKIKG